MYKAYNGERILGKVREQIKNEGKETEKEFEYCGFHRGNSDTTEIKKKNEWFVIENTGFNYN